MSDNPDNTKPKVDRRNFLYGLGAACGIAAVGTQATASLRSLVPNVSYDSPTTVKLGPPSEYPDGLKVLPDQRLYVFREGGTFHAISAVCTHLGCTVRASALSQPKTTDVGGKKTRLTHEFLCPCHGSKYTGDGTNYAGPAPKPLKWFRLSVAADDGQLVVDLADEVDHAFRFTL
jgi:cytochrome b6-f complex iron-sulfur subunit